MQLHELQPRHAPRSKKTRVGRGGKRGTTSGRGTKGQRSRSGHRIRPAERDYIQRLPKLRGFRNRPIKLKTQVVNFEKLTSISSLKEITPETLRQARLIRSRSAAPIKILGHGTLSRPLAVRGVAVSSSVRKAILAAGGTIKE